MKIRMLALIFLITIINHGIVGGRLTRIENEQIHQICGIPRNQNKVLNGVKAAPSEAPWTVAIAVERLDGVMHCTGTLVSSRHVITARHCFVKDFEKGTYRYVYNDKPIDYSNCVREQRDFILPKTLGRISLFFGTLCRSSEACEAVNAGPNLVGREVKRVIMLGTCTHKSQTMYDHDDFAIVELDGDILFSESIHPICLAEDSRGLNRGDQVQIYGFGFDPADRKLETGILKSEISHVLPCGRLAGNKYVCSMSANSYQLACRGDSGGGVVSRHDNSIFLVAIVSRGEPCRVGYRHQADFLAPVYRYTQEICHYTGICSIIEASQEHNVEHLYGKEKGEDQRKSGAGRILNFFLLILVRIIFYQFFKIKN